jgi:hypothetical protein
VEAQNVVVGTDDCHVVDLWRLVDFGVSIASICAVYLHVVLAFSRDKTRDG